MLTEVRPSLEVVEQNTVFAEADVTTWTDADNDRATRELSSLFGSPEGTAGWHRMDTLADLIESYEALHYPFPPPTP